MSLPLEILTYSSNPGSIAGYTIYKQVIQKEIIIPVGWETHQEDFGDMFGSRNITKPVYDKKIIDVVNWIAVPEHLVTIWITKFMKE
jgi:hypothetical protein